MLGTGNDCFALLDDCEADAGRPGSRLYSGYVKTLTCAGAADLPGLFEAMQEAVAQGLHAVSLFDYELGAGLHGVDARGAAGAGSVLLFAEREPMTAQQVLAWLAKRETEEQIEAGNAVQRPPGVAGVRCSVTESGFAERIDAVKAYLEAGDIYQLNYTFRLHFDAFGSPAGLYRRLRERQPAPYGALIGLPGGGAVLSLSPELFVKREGGRLVAQPMKGTAAAGAHGDEALAQGLAADEKNRAENMMIVDLLRNDLGRIARTGSVEVPALFEVRRHGGVLQMTSTVAATPRDDVSLADIFAALFPCGSITGAPKRRAMQIIAELEDEPRGLYTGAIGWFDAAASDEAAGDFCLSVPIRTLVLEAERGGVREGVMGVGAGIVYDSTAPSEYGECLLKAEFLAGLPNEFELIETVHATRAEGGRHLDLHLRRMASSARYFGFAFDEAAVRRRLEEACRSLDAGAVYRVRLGLKRHGECAVQVAPLAPLAEPVGVLIAERATRSDDVFLCHKTSVRTAYDEAWREAEKQGAFDMLFFNERGELTEGGRSNVLIKLGGQWYTPPLASGLLPGVMRQALMADPGLEIRERILYRDELLQAEEIALCNALRGMVKALLVRKPG